jgi:hypothetical protein
MFGRLPSQQGFELGDDLLDEIEIGVQNLAGTQAAHNGPDLLPPALRC